MEFNILLFIKARFKGWQDRKVSFHPLLLAGLPTL